MTIRTWLEATVIRIIRTSAAAALGAIGAAVAFDSVAWDQVAGATALAAIITFLMCLAGLPEAHTHGPLERLVQPKLAGGDSPLARLDEDDSKAIPPTEYPSDRPPQE